jgi:hypothetical protein
MATAPNTRRTVLIPEVSVYTDSESAQKPLFILPAGKMLIQMKRMERLSTPLGKMQRLSVPHIFGSHHYRT